MNMCSRRIRAGLGGLMVVMSLVFLVSCSLNNDGPGNSQPATPVSYVSLYNASPNAPRLGLSVDNKQTNLDLDYGDYTGYLAFRTGERILRFGPADADNVTVDTTLTLSEGRVYSVFVVDEYSKASIFAVDDTSPEPVTGMAKLRLINLSPDAGDVQLAINSNAIPIIGVRSFRQASEFIEVAAGSYDVQVGAPGNGIKLSLPQQVFQAGKFYTILVKGYKTPPVGNTNVLSAAVVGN